MHKFITLDPQQQYQILDTVADNIGLNVMAVEKDFWVTEILRTLFSLPYADKMVFKGGTSLSKVWNAIYRFSEDCDIAVDRSLFGIEGDVTKKQLKNLRKASSIFVRDTLSADLRNAFEANGLSEYLTIDADPDGEGDGTYPEPRHIHIYYPSVINHEGSRYLREEVLLEVGARSLFEPTAFAAIESYIGKAFPQLVDASDQHIISAVPEKTFLEKAFLLHELFTTEGCRNANRKSRHLYDLYKMSAMGIADRALADDHLWETIRHHREVFTSIRDVDYTPDVRTRLTLLPPDEVKEVWRSDYDSMVGHMIYERPLPTFEEILLAIAELQDRFRNR